MEEYTGTCRIVLGAAALGQPYGIANPKEPAGAAEVDRLLDSAWARGVRCVDTAPAYGAADARLSAWMQRTGNRFSIVSKLPPVGAEADGDVGRSVRQRVKRICRDLHVDRLDGFLVHEPADFSQERVRNTLFELKSEGVLGAIGISAYAAKDVRIALDTDMVDTVQIPLNCHDNWMLENSTFDECRQRNLRIFVRSVFVQGL